jgi:hypothetical protein
MAAMIVVHKRPVYGVVHTGRSVKLAPPLILPVEQPLRV